MARSKDQPFESITVRVGPCPGELKQIVLNGGRTVRDALKARGLETELTDDNEIRVMNRLADLDTELVDMDVVLVLGPIEGNR